jgi:hypothetical protein
MGLTEGEYPIEVTPSKRFPKPAHDLHVLLRHRLLRKPGGLKGGGMSLKRLPAGDLAVAKPIHPSTFALVNGLTGLDPSKFQSTKPDHDVSLANEAVGDDARPDVLVVTFVPLPHLGMANQVWSARSLHLNGGVEQGEKFVHVARVVEKFDPPASSFNVLLRHRPRSISLLPQPGGFESSLLVGVRGHANGLSLPEGPHVEVAVPNLGVTPLDAPAVAYLDHDPLIVGMDYVYEVGAEVVEGRRVLPEYLPRGREASLDAYIRDLAHVHHEVRIEVLRRYVKPVADLPEHPAHDLDVLRDIAYSEGATASGTSSGLR